MLKLKRFMNPEVFSRIRYTSSQYSTPPHRTKITQEEDEDEGPIRFSTSPAKQYRAETTRRGYSEPRLWYEPYVIIGSIAVFLIYFCILREENDIDHELSRSLYSRISGLEEIQLKQALEYNRQHNMETKDIIRRLREIEKEKTNEPEE